MKKISCIDWLINAHFGDISNCTLDFRNKIEKAKYLHQIEIITACNQIEFSDDNGLGIYELITKGEQYYKETYKNKQNKQFFNNTEISFEESVKPLMKYLSHNYHPHTAVYVRSNFAELFEGKQKFITNDYILD